MKIRIGWIVALAALAVAGCAKAPEDHSPGKLRIICASASTVSSTCTPAASGLHPLGQVVTGITVTQGDVAYFASLAENQGGSPVTFRPMYGWNIPLGFGVCTDPGATWCWAPQLEYTLGGGDRYPIGIGNSVSALGDHQMWTLAMSPSIVAYLGGSESDLMGADFDPEDPAIQPYILDFARVEFTVVAP